MRPLLPIAALVASAYFVGACSNGLDPYLPVDTDFIGDPDTAEPADTEAPTKVNNPPVADAGPDQAVPVTSTVPLDGTSSYDPDGDALSYRWTILSSPTNSTASVLNATRVNASFYADRAGVFLVELEVGDIEFLSTDTVTVTVEAPNNDPIAIPGADQYVDVGDRVTLNGGQSYDPDGDSLSYQWVISTRPAGSSATLSTNTSAIVSFTADVAGQFVITLVVSDGESSSAPAQVRVIAQEPSSSDCFSCAEANIAMERQLSVGGAASGPGLILLPLLVMLWQRRRED